MIAKKKYKTTLESKDQQFNKSESFSPSLSALSEHPMVWWIHNNNTHYCWLNSLSNVYQKMDVRVRGTPQRLDMILQYDQWSVRSLIIRSFLLLSLIQALYD